MRELSIIDPQAIENLRALNPADGEAFLREIAGIFLEDTPHRLADLDRTLGEGDTVGFARAAHSIKGSSANLGATALQHVAELLEQRARTEGIGNVSALVEQVKAEFARAAAELKKLVAL